MHMAAFNNFAQSLMSGNASTRTSLMNNSNASTASNGLVPVAFLPISAFLPCVQNLYNEMSQKESSISQMTQVTQLNEQSFCVPQLELNKPTVEFGTIPEGCYDATRVLFKLNTGNGSSLNSTLRIELDDVQEWSVTSLKSTESKKRVIPNLDALKPKLNRTLCLGLTKLNPESKSIELELSNFYEFFVHLDTREVNYFKEILKETNEPDSLEPINVKSFISVYYCLQSGRRHLLSRVEVSYVLGYARLKTSANVEQIVFDLGEESAEMERAPVSNKIDYDKTLMSVDEQRRWKNVEQAIPLSNAGNINVEAECYLAIGEQRLQVFKFQGYELRTEKELVNLEARAKSKRSIKLILAKLRDEETRVEGLRLVIQVKPNGFKCEIPICFKQRVKQKTNLKLSASRAVLFFGKALGFQNEFNLMNSNEFKIKVIFFL